MFFIFTADMTLKKSLFIDNKSNKMYSLSSITTNDGFRKNKYTCDYNIDKTKLL